MFEWMTRHKKTLMTYTLWLVIPSFILLYGYGQCAMPQIIPWVVRVNGDSVNSFELRNREEGLRNRIRQQNPDAELDTDQIRQQAMQQAIIATLMEQTADQLGLSATDQEVIQAVQTFPSFLDENGQFNYNQYVTLLNMNGFTPEEFEQQQREAITIQKIQTAIEGAALEAQPEEARKDQRSSTEMQIEYLAFEPTRYTDRVEIDEEGLQAFFDENQEEYRIPEQRRIAYAAFSPADYLDQVEMLDTRVEAFFNRNINNYMLPEQATVSYLTYTPAAFADAVNPTTDEIRERYNENPEAYQTRQEYFVRYAPVAMASVASVDAVTEEAIQAYYEENITLYEHDEEAKASHILLRVTDATNTDETEAVRQRLLEIKQEIEETDLTFAEAASQYSEDPSAQTNSGDLGYFGRGMMVHEFEEVAFTHPLNEISDPVQTQFGWHILLVEDRKEAGTDPLETVRDEIRETLANERAYRELEARAATMTTLDDVTDQYPVQTLGWVEQGEDLTERLPDMERLEAMFMRSAIFRTFDDNPVRLSGNANAETLYFIEIVESREPRTQTLAEARDEIIEQIQEERGEEIAAEAADADFALIQSGDVPLSEIAEQRGLTVRTSQPFARDAQFVPGFGARPTALLANVFNLEPGQITGPIETSTGQHIVQLLGVEESRLPELSEVRNQVEQDFRTAEAERIARGEAISFDIFLFEQKNENQMSLTDAAAEKGIDAETTDFFGQGEAIPSLGMQQAVNTAAFQLETVGEVNEMPIEASAQNRQQPQQDPAVQAFYIIELLEIQDSYLPTLDEVREDVETDYSLKLAEDIARAEAEEAIAQIEQRLADSTPVSATQSIDLSELESLEDGEGGEYSGPHTITGTGSVPGIGGAYPVIKTAMNLQPGQVSRPIPNYIYTQDEDGKLVRDELGGVYIIQLLGTSQKPEDAPTGFQAQIEQFMMQQRRQMTASAWLEEASAVATIEYNESFLFPEEEGETLETEEEAS